jgi:hypothetical protein
MHIFERRLEIRHKTIGASHDPYGRTSYIVKINGTANTLVQCGLVGDWFEINGLKISLGEKEAHELFRLCTGMTLNDFHRYYHHDHVEDPMGPLSWYI